MKYRIRRVFAFRSVQKLNDLIFPGEPLENHPYGTYWLLYQNGKPIGFASLHPLIMTGELDTVFLSRSGVIRSHRGKGLGGRLLDARISHCKKHGFKYIVTYTIDNIPSANNLISRGFRLYDPEYRFGGKGALHWLLKL